MLEAPGNAEQNRLLQARQISPIAALEGALFLVSVQLTHPKGFTDSTRFAVAYSYTGVTKPYITAAITVFVTPHRVQSSFPKLTASHYNVARRTIIWEIRRQSRRFVNSIDRENK